MLYNSAKKLTLHRLDTLQYKALPTYIGSMISTLSKVF